AARDVLAHVEIGFVDGQSLRGRDVHHLPRHVVDHDLQVLPPLPVTQHRVDRRSLGVDHDGVDGSSVEAVEDVAQGTVGPQASEQVQLGEQQGEGVEQLLAPGPEVAAGQELPVAEGVVDVAGDQAGG